MCLTVHVISLGHVNIVCWSLFVIGSYDITHLFCLCSLLCSRCQWLTSLYLWLALCVPVSCIELCTSSRNNSSLPIARLALIVSVCQCFSYLSFVASFLFCSFLCSLFSVFVFFFSYKIRKSKRRKSSYGLPITSSWQTMKFILFLWPESSYIFNPIFAVSKDTWKSIGLYS